MTMFVKEEKGQALTEFALVIPIFMTFLLVVIQLGIIFGSQIVLNTAAKEGVRLAAVGAENIDVKDRVLRFASLSPFIDMNRDSISIYPDFENRVWEKDVTVTINTAYVPIFLPFTGRTQYKLNAAIASTNFERGSTSIAIDEGLIGIRDFRFNRHGNTLYLILEIEDYKQDPIDGAHVKISTTEPDGPDEYSGYTGNGGLFIIDWQSINQNCQNGDYFEARLDRITHSEFELYDPAHKPTVSYTH